MRSDKICDAIGLIDDDIIISAEESRSAPKSPKKASKRPIWIGVGWAAACAVIAGSLAFGINRGNIAINSTNSGGENTTVSTSDSTPVVSEPPKLAEAIYRADYPETLYSPDYLELIDENYTWTIEEYRKYQAFMEDFYDHPAGYADGLEDFFSESTSLYLSEADGENIAYSPINVYMTLAMLAETTDGNSRQQILDVLDAGSLEDIRQQANAVWESSFLDNGMFVSVMGNSIWLRNDLQYNEETLKTLAENYYVSSFEGEMGSAEYNRLLQEWLNEQTRGLLQEQVSGEFMEPETVASLISTIYLKAQWVDEDEFDVIGTAPRTFYMSNGKETECDFMNRSSYYKTMYTGENFTCIKLDMMYGGSMWLVLPDTDISAERLASDRELLAFIYGGEHNVTDDVYEINISVPKFDIVSTFGLEDGLSKLGITDVFDSRKADFSPLTDNTDGISVSSAEHTARVKIDEEGVEAAAYSTLNPGAGGEREELEKIDFILDRPFLFFVTGNDDLPLFTGIVNKP